MSECEQFPISVMLTSKDTKKSIAFYRDLLGFVCKETWPGESDPKWANLLLGNHWGCRIDEGTHPPCSICSRRPY